MTPQQKVEALLRKTVAAGCPVGEVIAANELAVTLAIKYRIPSESLVWPALPAGYRWEGQKIVEAVVAPKPQPQQSTYTPPPRQQRTSYNTTGATVRNITDLRSGVWWALRTVKIASPKEIAEWIGTTPNSVRPVLTWLLQNNLARPVVGGWEAVYTSQPNVAMMDQAHAIYVSRTAPYQHPNRTARPARPAPSKPAPQPAPKGKAAAVLAKLNSWPGTALSVSDIVAMTGWQPHTVRGWVSIQNKSRRAAGLPDIKSTRNKAGELTYYI